MHRFIGRSFASITGGGGGGSGGTHDMAESRRERIGLSVAVAAVMAEMTVEPSSRH